MHLAPAVRLVAICLTILCATAQAAVIHVSPTGNDANSGQTWPTAKQTVQVGLDAATAGDQVWVAAGTYVENIWLVSGVQLYGGFAGGETDLAARDWTTNVTILDGDQLDSVVTAPPGTSAATRVDGFVIRNGVGGYAYPFDYVGGGIYCNSASPTIANNSITANSATAGGGICCLGVSSPTIINNTIFANNASLGAGIYSDSTSLLVTGNTITSNAGGLGGGISLHNSSGTVAGNTITSNTAADAGGGIYCKDATSRIADNVIIGNSATGSDGGGICCDYSDPTIVGNTIAGNMAVSDSGGIYCSANASPTIRNTIIAFNSSGIGIYGFPIPSTAYNCVYGNRTGNYSGLANPTGTNGNISVDPQFTAANPGPDTLWGTADDIYADLHLLDTSPCRNTGDPAFAPTSGETDIDGQARVMAGRVDIGADEFTWTGDANQDGYVDVVDLLGVVYAFGTSAGDPGYDPTCDFNHDGYIDVVDLLDIVYNFGK